MIFSKFRRSIATALASALCLLSLCSCSGSGLIVRIEFAGDGLTASMRNIDYDLSALEAKAEELDAQLGSLPVLKNVPREMDKDKLLSTFGLDGTEPEKQTSPDASVHRSGTKTLVVYDAGFISYRDTSLYDQPCTLSEEEARSIATEKATAAGLDLSDLTVSGVTFADDIATVSFSREINGVQTVGQTGLTVKFNGGEISSLNYSASAYSGELEIEPIGVAAALAELLTENSSQTFGRQTGQAVEAIRRVKVTDVKFVYWDSAYTQTQMYQTHIQPVYCFTGTCTDDSGNETPFTGYVRAISDDITANFRVDEVE